MLTWALGTAELQLATPGCVAALGIALEVIRADGRVVDGARLFCNLFIQPPNQMRDFVTIHRKVGDAEGGAQYTS